MSFKHLRTLTRKSKLNFGPYKDCSVGYLIDTHRMHILHDLYYKASMISFMDDILDDLGITEEWRIEKPGTDLELRKEFYAFIGPKRQTGIIVSKAKRRKAVHRKFHNVDYKSVLQAKNQGR